MTDARYDELMERREALHRFWMDTVLPKLKARYGPEPSITNTWAVGPVLAKSGTLYLRVWVQDYGGFAYDIMADPGKPIRVVVNSGAPDLI